MAALHINGMVLIGEPMDERMAELMLGDEGAAGRAAENNDVEPAQVIGN